MNLNERVQRLAHAVSQLEAQVGEPAEGRHVLRLTDYEAANLIAALQAGLHHSGMKRNPLWALNSGDWLGQIAIKLDRLGKLDCAPNKTSEQLADEASSY